MALFSLVYPHLSLESLEKGGRGLQKKKYIIAATLFVLVVYIGVAAYIFPTQIILMGEENPIKLPRLFALKSEALHWGQSPLPLKPGENDFTLNFLGVWPLKKTQVFLLERCYLRLGGHSVGVILESDGLKVAGFYPVITEQGVETWPGKDANLEMGAYLLEGNGEKLTNSEILQRLTLDSPLIRLKVRRGKRIFETTVVPRRSKTELGIDKFLGIFLAEPVMGVGTLTFTTEDGRGFAALGHVIGDGENDSKGLLKKARIVGIKKGERGTPGEKLGLFERLGQEWGYIKRNTPLGIYGEMNEPLESELIELAFYEEITTGPATILTVLEDDIIEPFDAYIEQVFARREPTNRSFVIRVTDNRLIQKAGGIIQGMSGSPVIQNGKLIGAVTHVFVNDPQRGYGALAEWMALEAGAFNYIKKQASGS